MLDKVNVKEFTYAHFDLSILHWDFCKHGFYNKLHQNSLQIVTIMQTESFSFIIISLIVAELTYFGAHKFIF